MRIGLITQAYYPVLGGVTEHVWSVGTELQRRGHDVTVVTGTAETANDRGLRVLRYGRQIPLVSNGASVRVTWAWNLGRYLEQVEDQERFDVLHIHSPLDPVLPLTASRRMRTPKVGTHHSARDSRSGVDFIPIMLRPVFAEAARRIHRHVAVSTGARWWVRRYLPEVKFDIIPNGIDVDRFRPDHPPTPERTGDVFRILFVGRLDPRKGAKYLFRALPYLEERLERYEIVVVGSGWMRGYYDAHIRPDLRARVRFVGPVSPEELPRYYCGADVYCSPATGNESFGIVLLEAMASGTPVIASDIDGYHGVVTNGRDGLLVAPRDPRQLADAILALAHDPDQRRRMGRAGRDKALGFTWSRVVDRLMPLYEDAAATVAGARGA